MMTQASNLTTGVPQTSPFLTSDAGALLQALVTGHLGSAAPVVITGATAPANVGLWWKDVSATVRELYYYDGTSSILLLTTNPTAHTWKLPAVDVSANAGALPAAVATTALRVAGADGAGVVGMIDAFGGAGSFLVRRANGTAAAPTNVLNTQTIASFSARGYGATAYSTTRASILLAAAEDWTDSAQGTVVTCSTTPIGSTTPAEVWRVTDAGAFCIGTATPISGAKLTLSATTAPRLAFQFTDTASLAQHYYYEGTTLRAGVQLLGSTFATAARQGSLELFTSGAGAGFIGLTPGNTPGLRTTFEPDGSIKHRNQAQTIVDPNSHHQLRAYTVGTLPSAATAAQLIYVSDGTSNKRLAVSDGTNWRWPDGAIVS